MWGAIIGDLAGSIYEYGQVSEVSNVVVNNIIESNSFFSDDTILTVAILEAILHGGNYKDYLRKYIKEYSSYNPNFHPYFKTPFSPGTTKWGFGEETGYSTGNGAMMRISPVGYLFNSLDDVVRNASLATIPSHNTEEAINSATTVATIIYLARMGLNKEEIIKELDLKLSYVPFTKFNMTCNETLNNCLYALFTSNSFENSIRKVISFGGDTDTNACIVGSMAEALYGIDQTLIEVVSKKIPKQFVKTLELGYSKIVCNR